ncbi:MAG: hypothetical protein IRZ07_21695, partial [Microbispora sp.]|nr:hypothetical protein [Microbispora sp.]
TPPAPAALGPNDVLVARGTPTQDRLVASNRTAPQSAYPASAQPAAPQPAGQQPGTVDPNDPLGIGPVRPYVSEHYGNDTPLYTTGERLRPGQWQGGRARDPHAEPERRGGRRAAEWPGDGEENWGDTRAW